MFKRIISIILVSFIVNTWSDQIKKMGKKGDFLFKNAQNVTHKSINPPFKHNHCLVINRALLKFSIFSNIFFILFIYRNIF